MAELWLEQEIASIMKYVIDRAGKPSPYYWDVPSNFAVPAVYFPMPEIETGGETFLTYAMDYTWHIKLFDRTREGAHALGLAVISAIREGRNLVPLIEEDGSEIGGSWVRLDDPGLKALDGGAVQLSISWRSRRPYSGAEGAQRTRFFSADVFMKPGKVITDAYADAMERYAVPLYADGRMPGQEADHAKH